MFQVIVQPRRLIFAVQRSLAIIRMKQNAVSTMFVCLEDPFWNLVQEVLFTVKIFKLVTGPGKNKFRLFLDLYRNYWSMVFCICRQDLIVIDLTQWLLKHEDKFYLWVFILWSNIRPVIKNKFTVWMRQCLIGG